MNIIKENCRLYQGKPGIEIAALKTIESLQQGPYRKRDYANR
jgi:hypothetical protein